MRSAPDQIVTRRRLIEQLERVAPGGLVLIVAAAGYGKSTLLDQWAGRGPEVRVVVTATPDDDAGTLLHRVAVALAGATPAALPLVHVTERSEADWAVDMLPALLDLAARQPVRVAIDDTHVLTSRSSLDLLGELSAAWPAPSILVLAGRERPPVPLVRNELGAPIEVVTESDLDFDVDELAEAAARYPQPTDLDALLSLTGGWPAGVRLVALSREAPAGRDQITVERYLAEHVLSGFADHELDYLGHVATLAPAPVGTVDLVMRRNDTLSTLAGFQRRGLPMLSLPSTPTDPVRIHALLADLLVARLDRQDPRAVADLIDVAVDATKRDGQLTYAFGLLDRHGRRDDMRTFVYVCTFPMIAQGRTRELNSWLDRFTTEELESDPYLVFAHANVQRPRNEQAVRRLFARHGDDATTLLPDGSTPAIACRRMVVSFGFGPADPDETELLGGWRQTHAGRRSWDLYGADRLAEAEAVLLDVGDSAHKYPVTNASRLAKLAILALETGQPERAQQHAAEAERLVASGRMEESALAFLVDTAGLKLARRAGDLERAHALATSAQRKIAKMGDGTMLEQATTLIEIASLHLDAGHPVDAVKELLDEAEARTVNWPPLVRFERLVHALRARAAEVRETQPSSDVLTTAELRVLRFLPSHLTINRIAEELYVSSATVKTQVQSIYRKLGVNGRAQAVDEAKRLGLIA